MAWASWRLAEESGASPSRTACKVAGSVKIADAALAKKIFAALDRKLLQIARVRREIEALIVAAPLLAE